MQPIVAFLALALAACAADAGHRSGPKLAINPAHLPPTTQFGYSQGTSVPADAELIFVAGQVGVSDEGPNHYEAQVDRAFERLVAVLEAAGGRVEDVVKITVLIKDHDEARLRYLVEKRRAVFGEHPPASTLIPVTELALDSFEFEIDAVAVRR